MSLNNNEFESIWNDSYKKKVNHLFSYYEKYGSEDYIGEPVSQVEHMIQAAMLAEQDNQPRSVILAALFHDIGHLVQYEADCNLDTMNKYGVKNHENIGLNLLKNNNIPYPIPQLVENHVKVKKYKVYKYPEYYKVLSDASKKTLEYQGGPMTETEANAFEKDPLFKKSLLIRLYDDKAKIKGLTLKPLEYYKDMCYKFLEHYSKL